MPFLVQLSLFLSPVAFSTNQVPERWRLLYSLNPLVGIIDGFRWSILGGAPPLDSTAVTYSAAITAACLAAGFWYFRRTERGFADAV